MYTQYHSDYTAQAHRLVHTNGEARYTPRRYIFI